MAAKKKGKHHKFSRTSIEHHKDGSHTVHHQHESDAKQDVKHAASHLDALHDSMEQHLGAPNSGEQEAESGQHGVPAAQAGPAGLQMPVAAGAAPGGGMPGAGA